MPKRTTKIKVPSYVPWAILLIALSVGGYFLVSKQTQKNNASESDIEEAGRFYPPAPVGGGSGGGIGLADLNALGVPTQAISQGASNGTPAPGIGSRLQGTISEKQIIHQPPVRVKNPPQSTVTVH